VPEIQLLELTAECWAVARRLWSGREIGHWSIDKAR